MKLQAQRFSIAGAIFAALGMLLLSIANTLGVYQGAVSMMEQWHMFYSPTVGGTIAGMIEAAIITYVSILVFVWIYGLLGSNK